MDRGNPFNQGCDDGTNWIETVNELDEMFDKRFRFFKISRADLYVLAAQVGIENAVNLNNKNCIPATNIPSTHF